MQLSALLLAARILDPRLWKLRLKQLAAVLGGTLWVWYRSVDLADDRRAVRDARRELRNRRIHAKVAAIEQAREVD